MPHFALDILGFQGGITNAPKRPPPEIITPDAHPGLIGPNHFGPHLGGPIFVVLAPLVTGLAVRKLEESFFCLPS